MLRLEVLELITILELILAAKNPKKVIDTINYYYDFPGQTSLTEILENSKNNRKEFKTIDLIKKKIW